MGRPRIERTPEEQRALQAKWARDYRARHPGRAADSSAKWAKKNPEKVKESRRNWYHDHKQESLEAHRRWIEQNPDWHKRYRATPAAIRGIPYGPLPLGVGRWELHVPVRTRVRHTEQFTILLIDQQAFVVHPQKGVAKLTATERRAVAAKFL